MIDGDDMSSPSSPPSTPPSSSRIQPTAAASREAFVEQEFHAGRELRLANAKAPIATAADVVEFWRQAGPSMWFAKDADFDRRFREAFLPRSGRLCRIERDLRKPVSLITRNQKMATSPTPRSCVRLHANLF
jgi:hypothetical protein